MTVLAWNRTTPQPVDTAPQTHALVIGVSHYAHLRGGSKYVTQPCAENLRLKQLTSPSLSAVEFAEFLRDEYENPEKPLGSVDVLLSPQSGQNFNAPFDGVDRATFGNISSAFADWIDRCTKHTENVGIFYFCGHGLEKGEHILLPEDFGSNPNDAWDTSISFDLTYAAMGGNKFETQLYLVDACRELPTNLALNHTVRPRPLETLRNRSLHDRDAPILKATTQQNQAEAQPGQVSYFTQAVLDCFRRLGAERLTGNDWVVTTSSLKRAVQMHMERKAPTRCDTGGGVSNFTRDLHVFPGPASVFAEIRCQPTTAHALAKLLLSNPALGQAMRRDSPKFEPWLIELESTNWDVEARFQATDGYHDIHVPSQIAWPPKFTPQLHAKNR